MSEPRTERTEKGAICLLVTHGLLTPWEQLLKHAGLEFHVVNPQKLAALENKPPQLVFFDTTCDRDTHQAFRALLGKWGQRRPVVMALVPSHEGAVAASDLRAAQALDAFDILMSESRPATLAARVHFALLSASVDAGGVVLKLDDGEALGPRRSLSERRLRERRGRRAVDVLGHEAARKQVATLLATGGLGGTALILIDLDRFKRIASRYGHRKSDAILATVAERIYDAAISCAPAGGVRAAPVLARLAADEFLLLLPAITSREAAAQFAHSVLRAIAAPLEQNGDRLYLSASAGIAVAPEDATEAEALLRAAHTALTHAKQRRGSSFAFYTPHVAATQAHRLEIEHRLRQAMASSELLLHYQPQASVESDEIVGIEALVRWSHPDLGLISPESFIGIAEEAGITAELGRWVVSRALAEIVNLERHGLPPLRLSINISADMFATMGGRGLAEHIIEELAASGMPGSRVILEVTERSILARVPQTLRAIEHLREHGVRFALDDFGTGYSALGTLKTLPVDEIKIDRSFILGAGIEDVAVLRAIIAMAKTLDLTVIAEGVETPDQLRMLRAEGCDLYQGYLCAPALPGPQLIEVLKDRNAAPA